MKPDWQKLAELGDENAALKLRLSEVECERDELALKLELLEDANRKIGRQLLEHSDEVNSRGERIDVLTAKLTITADALRDLFYACEYVGDQVTPDILKRTCDVLNISLNDALRDLRSKHFEEAANIAGGYVDDDDESRTADLIAEAIRKAAQSK